MTMIAAVVQNAMWSPMNICSMPADSGAKTGASAEMDTSMAVPSEAATWLSVFDRPCACWITSLDNALTPQVLSGVIVNCRPMVRNLV